MSHLMEKWKEREGLCSFLLFAFILFLLYPDLCLMKTYVMGHTTWELHDPAVSNIAFVPGFRLFKFELFEHGNLLWSSLRGMGYPILGNEVQVAPLFPLTWLWIWAPEPYFWNLLFLSRMLLLALASYWVGRSVLRLQSFGAFIFSFTFAFAVHVLRWANHPWQNGLLAGLCYLYFLHRGLGLSGQVFNMKRTLNTLGIAFGAYSLVTCGFPEAALMGGMLTLFLLIPLAIEAYRSGRLFMGRYFSDIALAHLIGFMLSSPQIFGLIELMGENPFGFRSGTGRAQYTNFSILIPMLTRLTDSRPSDGAFAIHFFNLIPFFFFLYGLARVLKSRRLSAVDLGVFFIFLFWVLKCFPLWPWFNRIVGDLPIANGTWFIIYFFSFPILFFGYYAARGAEFFSVSLWENLESAKHPLSTPTRLLGILIMGLLLYCASRLGGTSAYRALKVAYLFAGFLVAIEFLMGILKKNRPPTAFYILCTLFLIAELTSVRMDRFMSLSSGEYREWFNHQRPQALKTLLEKNGLQLSELREDATSGDYSSIGLGTLNSPGAIIPDRLNTFYAQIFETLPGWGGSMPIQGARFPYSWALASVNLHLETPVTRRIKKEEKLRYRFLAEVDGTQVYYDPESLPRSYLASSCVSVAGGSEAIAELTNPQRFHLGKVVLEGLGTKEASFCRQLNASKFHRIVIANDQGSSLQTSVHGPGILVLNDNFFKGWIAKNKLTGEVLPIYRANHIFRGLVLPESQQYQIEWRYEPSWVTPAIKIVKWGLAFSLVLLLIASRQFWLGLLRFSGKNPSRLGYEWQP